MSACGIITKDEYDRAKNAMLPIAPCARPGTIDVVFRSGASATDFAKIPTHVTLSAGWFVRDGEPYILQRAHVCGKHYDALRANGELVEP